MTLGVGLIVLCPHAFFILSNFSGTGLLQTLGCPIYQNVTALPILNESEIKMNLISQLTAPVKWTQSVQQMIIHGGTEFIEVGPGNVLQGLVRKINREMDTKAATIEN